MEQVQKRATKMDGASGKQKQVLNKLHIFSLKKMYSVGGGFMIVLFESLKGCHLEEGE